MRRKTILLGLVFVFVMFIAFTGCQSSNKDQQKAKTEADISVTDDSQNGNDKKVTLSLVHWDMGENPTITKQLEAFNKHKPNIQVNVTVEPWEQYWTKLQTTVSTGASADIFMMNVPSFGAYYKAGAMLNLKEYVKKVIIDFSKYPKALVDVYTEPNGNVWGISKAFDAIGLFYNKALFDKAKVEYPNDTWTWDDLRSAAKKLTSDGVWGFTVSPENQDGYYNFLVQNGGGIISDDKKKSLFDKPESIEAIQFLYDLIFVDKVSPDRNKLIETEYTTLFQGERTAMATMGCWMVESCYDALGEKLGVAPLPKGKVNGNSIIHGEAWCISSKSKYPDQAWEVLKFFESDESNNIAADIGYILPSKAGFQQKWVESVPGVNKQLFVDAAQKAGSTYPFSIETSKWQEVEGKYIADIFAGIITPEEGCKKIADEMNQILANEQ